MNELMEEKATVNPPPPPPPPHRRPRVREVSSRFMSPVASSSSSSSSFSPLPSIKQRSTSVQRQRHHDTELLEPPLSCADENRQTARGSPHRRNPRAVVKLFKENEKPPSRSHRPDTPVVATASSKLRLMHHRSTANTHISAATKLLHSTGISSSSSSSDGHDNSSNNNKISNDTDNNQVRSFLPDLRSSMPEADMLPSVSSRFLAERNINRLNNATTAGSDSFKISASACSRSLNLPRSTGEQHSLLHSLKATERAAKQSNNSVKIGGGSGGGGLPLPPVPPCAKLVNDCSRKGRKVSSHQEDVYSLRLLHNHYLQWRYVNAKAEASIQAQRRETERTLYSLGVKKTELYDSVKRKRIELGLLQRSKTLSTIVDAQLPYLDEWSALESDYSISLSEAIQALMNASLQVPISGTIRADKRELGEALNSAIKLMETISCHIQNLMPKAEETENLISELAKVTGGERALIEECGDLLSVTHKSQVEECSLRCQLIQLHQCCHG